MAADKLVDSSVLNTNLTSVANAIRTKGGTTESLAFPDGFVTAINNISSFKPEETFDITPTTQDLPVTPQEGYVFSSGIVRAMPTGQLGTVSATKTIDLTNHKAIITPSMSEGTAGYNAMSAVTGTVIEVLASELADGSTKLIQDTNPTNVAGYTYAQVSDSNLTAENIVKDVTILGIKGTKDLSGYTKMKIGEKGPFNLDGSLTLQAVFEQLCDDEITFSETVPSQEEWTTLWTNAAGTLTGSK